MLGAPAIIVMFTNLCAKLAYPYCRAVEFVDQDIEYDSPEFMLSLMDRLVYFCMLPEGLSKITPERFSVDVEPELSCTSKSAVLLKKCAPCTAVWFELFINKPTLELPYAVSFVRLFLCEEVIWKPYGESNSTLFRTISSLDPWSNCKHMPEVLDMTLPLIMLALTSL